MRAAAPFNRSHFEIGVVQNRTRCSTTKKICLKHNGLVQAQRRLSKDIKIVSLFDGAVTTIKEKEMSLESHISSLRNKV
jgi:hypothetical protein